MTYSSCTEQSILSDKNFCSLLRMLDRDPLTWDTFLACPLPSSISPMASWELLNQISQCIGMDLIPMPEGNMMWYRKINRIIESVVFIIRRSEEGTLLYRVCTTNASLEESLRKEEACAALRLAGLGFPEEQAGLFDGVGIGVDDMAIRLANNTQALDMSLANYVDEPFSDKLFEGFRAALFDGIDENDVNTLEQLAARPVDEARRDALEAQLGHILAYANDEQGDEFDHPILRGNLLADILGFYRPYGCLSAVLGSLATRLYYLKHGLIVLANLPLSAMKAKWMTAPETCEVYCTADEYTYSLNRCLGDLTFHQVLSLEFITRLLRDMEESAQVAEKDSLAVRDILGRHPEFNHRQRSILARALCTPDAEFNIDYHRKKHGIGYATARRDLISLKEEGYLETTQSGKAFVFTPGARIQDLARTMHM